MIAGLARLAERDFDFPARLGGEQAVTHALTLRFTLDAGLPIGHVVSIQGNGEAGTVLVRNALAWDEVSRSFQIHNHSDVERLAARLDPVVMATGLATRVLAAALEALVEVGGSMLSPNVILIGGVFTVVAALFLWWAILLAFWWYASIYVLLPGGALLLAAHLVWTRRVNRLRHAIRRVANAACNQLR